MQTLLQTIRPDAVSSIPAEVWEKLVIISKTDFSDERTVLLKDLQLRGMRTDDAFVEEGFLAYKQYMAIALLDQQNPHATSDVNDPWWHAHILCTENYDTFCADVFGKKMHHYPLQPHMELSKLSILYHYTVSAYDKVFKHVSETMFPRQLPDANLICLHNTDCTKVIPELLKIFPINTSLPQVVFSGNKLTFAIAA